MISWRISVGCLMLYGLCGLDASADILHLRNGNSIEGIVINENSNRVTLQLAFGEMVLSRSAISRVERATSVLEDYFLRRDELVRTGGDAADWVALARWAWLHNLNHSSREAARSAAASDPHVDGLAELMADFDFVFDEALNRWISSDDYMLRRGYILSEGRWVDAAQLEEMRANRRQLQRTIESEQRRDQLTQAMELLVISQMVQVEENRGFRQERFAKGAVPFYGGVPVAVAVGGWYGVVRGERGPYKVPRHPRVKSSNGASHAGAHRALRVQNQRAILSRQTGSFIPVQSPRHHRGEMAKAGASSP